MHDLLGALNEHGDHVGTFFGLEDQSGHTPFEVSHTEVGRLMDHAFGENVKPAAGVAGVAGGCEVEAGIIRLGRIEGRSWKIRERVDAVVRPRGCARRIVKSRIVVWCICEAVDTDRRHDADCLSHSGLKGSAEGRMDGSMGGKSLSEGEEVGSQGILEADVMACEGPSVVHVAMIRVK